MLDWNVAIYCSNEADRIASCIESVARGLQDRRSLITVIVNGSADRSAEVAISAACSRPVDVFTIPFGDKSNAMNQFLYHLRSPARSYAGVDGYCTVGPDTFAAMDRAFEKDRHATVLAGVSLNGRTTRALGIEKLQRGSSWLSGNLYGVRSDFVNRMTERGIRFPVRLYRGDGLLGSMAAHDLNCVDTEWDNTRMPGVAEATFELHELSRFRPADIRRQFRRQIRQARGTIENAAIKHIIYRQGYEGLPSDAVDMMRTYLERHDAPRARGVARLYQSLALREIRQASPLDPAVLAPKKMGRT